MEVFMEKYDLIMLKHDYDNSFTNNEIDDDQINKCIRYIKALEHSLECIENSIRFNSEKYITFD